MSVRMAHVHFFQYGDQKVYLKFVHTGQSICDMYTVSGDGHVHGEVIVFCERIFGACSVFCTSYKHKGISIIFNK